MITYTEPPETNTKVLKRTRICWSGLTLCTAKNEIESRLRERRNERCFGLTKKLQLSSKALSVNSTIVQLSCALIGPLIDTINKEKKKNNNNGQKVLAEQAGYRQSGLIWCSCRRLYYTRPLGRARVKRKTGQRIK